MAQNRHNLSLHSRGGSGHHPDGDTISPVPKQIPFIGNQRVSAPSRETGLG
jgi:hypothetical protein